MSKKQKLRFSVTDGYKKASTWSIVADKKKPEVYIFNRLLSTIHVSFHGSGKWHIKFGDFEEKQRVSLGQEVTDSYITKWERPQPFLPDVTIAFRIITPRGVLQKQKLLEEKNFIKIPNASPNNSLEILILFVTAGKEFIIKNATLIGSLTLSNGEQVYAIYTEIPATTRPAMAPNTTPDFTKNIKIHDLFKGNFGMIFFGDASDGSKVMWEISLKFTIQGYVKLIFKKIKEKLMNPS
jgi:hypothetical protein